MFTIPRQNVIESSEGYSVEVLGRTGLLYSEGDRYLRIDSEILAGPSGLVIYSDSIKHWDELENTKPFNEADKQRIIENIKAAFHFRGFDIEIN